MNATAVQRYTTVTEQPGQSASRLQLAMMAARYAWARRHSIGRDVLEAACGSGTGLGVLAEVARSVAACDIDPGNLKAAQDTYQDDPKIAIQLGDAMRLPYRDGAFDTVLLFEAIYYLPDARRFFDEARRVLRPGGSLLIATVNPDWSGFNPSPFHVRYFDAAELRTLLAERGFSAEIEAGFPERTSVSSAVIGSVRRAAVALGLVPKTMAGKALLKRLFYGPLEPIPPRLDPSAFCPEPFAPASDAENLTRYRVLYAHARKGQS